ncbi:MAG: N-acetyltransferase [Actinomycetota bacterium]
MKDDAIEVRVERPADTAASRRVHVEAFPANGAVEPAEAGLVDALRVGPAWIPDLSLVAVVEGAVVGHAIGSRGWVTTASEDELPVVAVGPVAVRPDSQGCGAGSALMRMMVERAESMDESLLALLGNPAYYERFGFRPSADWDIEPPESRWGAFFQALPLAGWPPGMRGAFRYPAAFDGLD